MRPSQKDTRLSDDALDRLLAGHLNDSAGLPQPSSGFVGSVMDAIREESAVPPPLAFPWRRAVPGIAATLCTAIVLFAFNWQAVESLPSLPWGNLSLPGSLNPGGMALVSTAGGLALSLIAVLGSLRLARGRR